ncbi:MAG: WxcM-like domain-containing protein [Bacteroidales bacterium]|nr:WxcM-like domain-containing protein [Bacteroidales bacterium]
MCKAYIIQLPKIIDQRGNLTFVETQKHVPFKIERVFWIYDVPGGEIRGGHAYKTAKEFIIALSGSFDVIVDDGKEKKTFSLNRSYYGLFVPEGTWRHMENFSTNALALVLASTNFNENDYIRNYDEFLLFNKNLNEIKSTNSLISKNILDINSKLSSVFDCSHIELNIHHREKGNITVVENHKTLPFNVNRVYYLYDIPGGEARGGHAHKNLYQLVVAASGSFDVILDDGKVKRTVTLNRPYHCLYIVPGIWRELVNFSSGSICLVLASEIYDENDYLREYEQFKKYKL